MAWNLAGSGPSCGREVTSVKEMVRVRRRIHHGLSLVEILVVIAIMAVVASMILATAVKVLAVVHQWT